MSATERSGRAALGPAPENWAAETPDPLTRDGQGPRLGALTPRLDGPAKVRGAAPFAAEFSYPDLVYAAVAYSTIAKGRIAALDIADAAGSAGVVLVMTHENAPRMNSAPLLGTDPKAIGGDDLPIMQDDHVHWDGQPIALVLAQTQEQADYAVSLLRVTYEAEPAVTGWEQAKNSATDPGSLFGHPIKQDIGEAEPALEAATASVDAVYRTQYQNHAAIEPHAATLKWDGDELFVHDASQTVVHSAWTLAQVFGIEETQVRVTSPYVGGGFGGKLLWRHHVLAAAAARLAGRPVRIVLSREGVFRSIGGRPTSEQRVAIGAGADGRFAAIIHTGTVAPTRHNRSAEAFTLPTQSSYASETFKIDLDTTYLDMAPNSTVRAPGGAMGSFALESAVDELAAALDMDPIELRIRNEPEVNPADGRPISSRNIVQAWREGAERFGWTDRNPTPGAVRDGEWLIGMGCAMASHLYIRMPGAAARITLTRDGRAEVDVPAHEMGMGTATAQTPVIADRLGLEPDQVSFRYGDSRMPGLIWAIGSSQSASIGAAVAAAQQELTAELLKLLDDSSPLVGLTVEQIGTLNGGLAALDDPTRHETYEAILNRAGRTEVVAEATALHLRR